MKFLALGMLIFGLQVAAPAQAQTENCFRKDWVTHFYSNNPNHVEIWSSGHIYDVEVWTCHNLPWAHRIAFKTFPSWDLEVCEHDDILVLDDYSNHVIQRCRIEKITRR